MADNPRNRTNRPSSSLDGDSADRFANDSSQSNTQGGSIADYVRHQSMKSTYRSPRKERELADARLAQQQENASESTGADAASFGRIEESADIPIDYIAQETDREQAKALEAIAELEIDPDETPKGIIDEAQEFDTPRRRRAMDDRDRQLARERLAQRRGRSGVSAASSAAERGERRAGSKQALPRQRSHAPSRESKPRISDETKQKASQAAHVAARAAKTVAGVGKHMAKATAPVAKRGAKGFAGLLKRSRKLAVVCAVLAAILAIGAVDFVANFDKVYSGVKVGGIDVSGMTAPEIEKAVNERYQKLAADGTVTIYASEEAKEKIQNSKGKDSEVADQLALEDAIANRKAWTATTASLGMRVSASSAAQRALAVGRENGGILTRLLTVFAGKELPITASYDSAQVAEFTNTIDQTIGEERVECDVVVNDGQANVTDGKDGKLIDRNEFCDNVTAAVLNSDDGRGSFVAVARFAPIRITHDDAQVVCDQFNELLSDTFDFTYEGRKWTVDANEMGPWLRTEVDEKADGSASMRVFLEDKLVRRSVLSHAHGKDDGMSVSIESKDDKVTVSCSGRQKAPMLSDTVTALDNVCFGQESKDFAATGDSVTATSGQTTATRSANAPVQISVASGDVPDSMTFDEACEYGVISEISTYTTEFSTEEGTEERNNNIELVSKLLNNSIVKPGENWSFNDTAGNCNEERGFQPAGSIVNGRYTKEVGGGICQVATTVFNAVYDSGFSVPERSNHSLYIASYPAGRDAAVSWPDLDLVWTNDSSSDVIVRMSTDESSVTCALYGVDPGFKVSSKEGEWKEGEKYSTLYLVDDNLDAGSSYIQTTGNDGCKISVTRTVKDSDGKTVRKDVFDSNYAPKDEVKVVAPGEVPAGGKEITESS